MSSATSYVALKYMFMHTVYEDFSAPQPSGQYSHDSADGILEEEDDLLG
jgi:hypothetical protein